jgi:uncharacterized protein
MILNDISVLIKPASSLCDLNCAYCFYHDEAKHRAVPAHPVMTSEISSALISRALSHAKRSCSFIFQGGEPTLAGLDYYKFFVEEVRRQNRAKLKINYSLQTNGQSIDNEWADFFRENRFLVGVSLDGTAEIHDRLRGEGTHKKALRATALLKSRNVEFNILTVVTSRTARNTEAVYNYFKRQGLYYQQYIPCIDSMDGESHLSAEEFGRFLIKLFRLWERDALSGQPVSIRYFDELALMLMGRNVLSCGMSGTCSAQYVIESDGSVYPCDFYCVDSYLLGNVLTDDFEAIDARRAESRFIESSSRAAEECRTCRYFALCRGGCRRDRDSFAGASLGLNRHCAGYKLFFNECADDLVSLALRLAGR